ncbi:hypothetical protein Dimus_012372 [Dionaea muscipula]
MNASEERCEGCQDCRTWEEEIYWNHFQTLHFCQILPKDFHHHLIIPKKFAGNMWTKLPPRVSLKGPSGATWDVDLIASGEVVCFMDGWEEFVKACSLEENDILIFKYNGSSCFNVLIFNGKNFCEREGVYFIRKCGHVKPDGGRKKKRDTTEVIREEEDRYLMSAKKILRKHKDAVGELVEHDIGSQGTGSKQPVNGREEQPMEDDKGSDSSPTKEHGGDAAEKPRSRIGNGSKQPVNAREEQPMEDDNGSDSSPTKEHGGDAAEKPRSHIGKNPKRSLPSKSSGRTSSEISKKSSEKANIIHAEDGAKGRSSASTLENRPDVNGNALGKSTPQQSKRRGRPKRPAPANSSVELTAFSEEDISSEDEESGRLSPTSDEESTEEYNGSTGKRTPKSVKDKGMPKRGVHRKKVLVKGALPGSSSKSKTGPATLNPPGLKVESYNSNRRPITEMEKQNTFQLANKELTEGSFIKVMRPTYVYRHFFVPVPSDWAENHISPASQDMTLRTGEKTWSVRFSYGSKGVAAFASGWKKFALDNVLEEFDVCLFKLADQKDDTIVLEVKIFRVVQEVQPVNFAGHALKNKFS